MRSWSRESGAAAPVDMHCLQALLRISGQRAESGVDEVVRPLERVVENLFPVFLARGRFAAIFVGDRRPKHDARLWVVALLHDVRQFVREQVLTGFSVGAVLVEPK